MTNDDVIEMVKTALGTLNPDDKPIVTVMGCLCYSVAGQRDTTVAVFVNPPNPGMFAAMGAGAIAAMESLSAAARSHDNQPNH